MLCWLIHMKLGYTWERLVCLWAWLHRKAPCSVTGRWVEGGDRAWLTLLSGMQEGLGWDEGMQNFTMTQTLWISARRGFKDYVLKWLSLGGSKYGQRGPQEPLVPDSLLSLSWELSPALLPTMQLRLEVGKDAQHTARGRGNPWPHDFIQMVLGFSHNSLLLFLGRDPTSPLPERKLM